MATYQTNHLQLSVAVCLYAWFASSFCRIFLTVWWIFAILGKGIIDLTLYNDAFKLFTPNRNTGKFIRRAKDRVSISAATSSL